MSQRVQRRLAAIVAVDVVGYSRLMGRDETGTLAALRRHRSEHIDPLIGAQGGRIVKSMGDGLLLEFPSVVAAVQFAVAMQTGMVERNREVPDSRAMRFRIGVHVGDVIIEGEDIFGDGVNVAARIESLADSDGVALSDDAFRQIRDRLDVVWVDAGEHEVKNIARPIRIWRWCASIGVPRLPPRAGDAGAPPAQSDKPSIAVLPFQNMSGDPEQEYFADGMTEDLITDLSKISGLFVVARNSSFVFKGQPVDIREVARRLGVRFVLEGSVRKVGPRVRINVQLVDAVSGGHLWANRYDGTVDNVFELQDDVGADVVSSLEIRLRGDERARLRRVHTQSLDAYELYVRAKATPYPPVPERIDAAREMFERVIDLDPDFAGGYAGLSWMLAFRALFSQSDPAEAAARAAALARKGIEVDDSFGWSHAALGLALLLQGRHEQANTAIAGAIARQPNDADAHAFKGLFLALSGRPEAGIEPIEWALRLNPQFIQGPYLNLRSIILTLARDHAGALRWFEENIARQGPVGPPVLAFAATSYRALGKRDEAGRLVTRLATEFPAFLLRNWNFLRLVRPPELRQDLHDSMRAAGIPD